MISPEVLSKEIQILEDKEPSYTIMQQLASLYIVRDHMKPEIEGNDFMALAYKDVDKTISIMNELMEALQVINPRLYDGVMMQMI